MADTKITGLAELTTLAAADLLTIVDDPSGSPVTKKATITNVLKSVNVMGAITTLAASDEFLFVDDPAGTPIAKKVTITNLLKSVNVMGAITAQAAADEILIIDDPAGTPIAKKITLTNLFAGIPCNVGIGVTPTSKLHLKTDPIITLMNAANEDGGIQFENSGATVIGSLLSDGATGNVKLSAYLATDAITILATSGKVNIENTISLKERAAAAADVAAYGQLWVKTASPCELWFTDDAGADTKIA